MSIHNLSAGEVFELEGGLFEVKHLGERIIIAYRLDQALDRVPDLTSSDGWAKEAISDLRYYREHENLNDLL